MKSYTIKTYDLQTLLNMGYVEWPSGAVPFKSGCVIMLFPSEIGRTYKKMYRGGGEGAPRFYDKSRLIAIFDESCEIIKEN
jgi:hypothetical protein